MEVSSAVGARSELVVYPASAACSKLEQLAIKYLELDHDDLAPLTALTALTELHLPMSMGEGDCLPRGPYLSRLQVLGLSGFGIGHNGGGHLLPPALAAATNLHALEVDWQRLPCRLSDWPRVQVGCRMCMHHACAVAGAWNYP